MPDQIGQRIQRFRGLQGWSQDGLSLASGLPKDKIGKVERGSEHLRAEQLMAVAAALGVDVNALCYDVPPASAQLALLLSDALRQLGTPRSTAREALVLLHESNAVWADV